MHIPLDHSIVAVNLQSPSGPLFHSTLLLLTPRLLLLAAFVDYEDPRDAADSVRKLDGAYSRLA